MQYFTPYSRDHYRTWSTISPGRYWCQPQHDPAHETLVLIAFSRKLKIHIAPNTNVYKMYTDA